MFLDATIVKNLGTLRVCAKIRVVVLIALSIISVTVILQERGEVCQLSKKSSSFRQILSSAPRMTCKPMYGV